MSWTPFQSIQSIYIYYIKQNNQSISVQAEQLLHIRGVESREVRLLCVRDEQLKNRSRQHFLIHLVLRLAAGVFHFSRACAAACALNLGGVIPGSIHCRGANEFGFYKAIHNCLDLDLVPCIFHPCCDLSERCFPHSSRLRETCTRQWRRL